MKNPLVAAVCCALLACSSGGNAKIIHPELQFVQLKGPAEQNYPTGDIEVQYGIRIANRSSEPITLRRIQLRSVGLGGPYRLQTRTYFFERVIQPEKFEDVTFWAKAVAESDGMANDARAPVTVRAVVFFSSPAGGFRNVLTQMLEQTGPLGGPR
ncbi:MAG TPA: hypothetical protein VGQ36_06670 [Thermoanaerobaculia bacterium]|nr:hypothetical protein [Thermoanaerobaculia bacterium]